MSDNFFMCTSGDVRAQSDELVEDIRAFIDELLDENARLKEENARLKDENYKDSELVRMQREVDAAKERLDTLIRDELRGFGITENEEKSIQAWIRQHEAEQHGAVGGKPLYAGAIGGTYNYNFLPTSIGVLGKIECGRCGECFTFQDLL